MEQTKIQKLVDVFADSVAKQTQQIWEGNPSLGNKFARKYIIAFEKLITYGDDGRKALTKLFDHERPDVRAMAAGFLLRYSTVRAMEILLKEAGGEGMIAFEASEAIKRWNEGTWALDPAE